VVCAAIVARIERRPWSCRTACVRICLYWLDLHHGFFPVPSSVAYGFTLDGTIDDSAHIMCVCYVGVRVHHYLTGVHLEKNALHEGVGQNSSVPLWRGAHSDGPQVESLFEVGQGTSPRGASFYRVRGLVRRVCARRASLGILPQVVRIVVCWARMLFHCQILIEHACRRQCILN